MAPTDREADDAYEIVARMGVLIRAGDPKGADQLSRDALRARQDREYDRAARADDEEEPEHHESTATPAPRRNERKGEQYRRRLFALARPALILAPVNVVEVYLDEHPMWATWDDTSKVNARMLPVVQGLDPDDPLPEVPRLALPATVAGFFLYRALHLPRDLPRTELTADVYRIITEAIVTVDRLRAPEGLAADFAHVVDTAHMLLLRAVALGLDAWDHRLILRCPLGAKCQREAPFYVNAPKATAGHGACRTAAHRAGLRLVTTKGHHKKK